MKIDVFIEPISCLDRQLFLLKAYFNTKVAEPEKIRIDQTYAGEGEIK